MNGGCLKAQAQGRYGARMRGIARTTVLSNKELERTRSTHFAVSPRRSIQCSTDRVSILEAWPALKLKGLVVSQRWGCCP